MSGHREIFYGRITYVCTFVHPKLLYQRKTLQLISIPSNAALVMKQVGIFSSDYSEVGEGLPCHSTSHQRLNRCAPVTVTQSSDDSDMFDNINIYLQTANVRALASDHNLHQFLLANCSNSDKSLLQAAQAANIATLVVVIFPDS